MTPLQRAPLALVAAMAMAAACTPKFAPSATDVSPSPGTGKNVITRPSFTPTPPDYVVKPDVAGGGSPSPLPFFGTSPSPGATATPANTATATPNPTGGTPAPQAAVTPPRTALTGDDQKDKAVVTGKVFDLDGVQMVKKGINVTFKATVGGFERKFDCDDTANGGTADGGYLSANDFPPGTYNVTAVGYGYTPRTRQVVIDKGFKSEVDFGTPGQDDACYGLSDFPEITSVDFGADPTKVDGSRLHMVIHMSEPLSDEMKALLVANLRVLPVNAPASWVNKDQPDLLTQDPTTARASDFSYAITFPPGQKYYTHQLSANWSADKDLTIEWGIPLLNGAKAGKYQLALVSGGTDKQVVDISTVKHQLGMDDSFAQTAWPAADRFVNKVFLSPTIGPKTYVADTAQHRWASTHANALQFTLAPDDAPPKTVSLYAEVTRVPPADGKQGPENGTDLYVGFDKSLIAFGPGGVVNQDSALTLANYTFAVGINPTYLDQVVHADGVSSVLKLPADTVDFGKQETEQLGKEFVWTQPASGNTVTLQLNPDNDKSVLIHNPNPAFFFHDFVNDPCLAKTNVKAIKVRAGKVADAGGNAIQDTVANTTARQPSTAIGYNKPTGASCP